MTSSAQAVAPTLAPPGHGESRLLAGLFVLALAVRLAGLAAMIVTEPGLLIPPDTRSLYYPIARSLAAGRGYAIEGDPVTASAAAPVLPCWLALLVAATGQATPSLWLTGLGNVVFRAAAVVLVFLLTRRYFGRGAALAAAFLYLIDPWEAFWVGFVMKESLAVPAFLLAVWLLVRFREEPTAARALVAGAAVGFATLARFPSLLLMVAAALLAWPVAIPEQPRLVRLVRWSGRCAWFTLALLLVLAPWLVRNDLVLGQPVLSPRFAGAKFYTSNGHGIEMEQDGYYSPDGIDRALVKRASQDRSPLEKEGALFSITLKQMAEHPGETLKRFGAKAINLWRPTFAHSSTRNWLLLGLPYCLLMLPCLAGLGRAVWQRVPCAGLAVPLLLFVAIHLLYWGEIRNRQYLTPLLYAFGGLALARRRPPAGVSERLAEEGRPCATSSS